MKTNNILLQSDSYKVSHHVQYPSGTTNIYSYFESRGGRFDNVVFYGLQYYLKEYLAGVRVTHKDIDQAKAVYAQHFGNTELFNEAGWRLLVDRHHGKLPVRIKAVPEGTVVATKNVLMTVENTDPDFYWLTNYLETMLVQVWYTCTVATYSREIKKMIHKYLVSTGCEDVKTQEVFKLHDFGYRGSSSQETSALGGSAHLINFWGTDTVSALSLIMDYYNSGVVGYSIPASEHSTITSWGKEHEVDAFRNMLEKYPTGLVACVSDSYDIYNACWELWGTELRDMILNREGTLVVRPDSGKPIEDVVLKIINILGDRFGYTTNYMGFKVLDPHVRIIQGDGVEYETINDVLRTLKNAGWAAENIAFGSGGALLQRHDRDELKFAFKCSAAVVNGEEVQVFKNPVTDPGKMSKKGRLKLVKSGQHEYETVPEWSTKDDELVTVFENGEITKEYTFSEIRERARIY